MNQPINKLCVVLYIVLIFMSGSAFAKPDPDSGLAITYSDQMVINHEEFKGYELFIISSAREKNGQSASFKFKGYNPVQRRIGVKQPLFYALSFMQRRELRSQWFRGWFGLSMDLIGQSYFDPEHNPAPIIFGLDAGVAVYPLRHLGLHASYYTGTDIFNRMFGGKAYNFYGPRVGLEWKF